MSISTRQGDSGETSLLFGERVAKTDARVEACGAIDELNSHLGFARALSEKDSDLAERLEALQRDCFILGADIAAPESHRSRLKQQVTAEMTEQLNAWLGELEKTPGLLDDWALPGSTQTGAAIDIARTAARRAERRVARLSENNQLCNPEILRYLNRISDLLWAMGRCYEMAQGERGALRDEGLNLV